MTTSRREFLRLLASSTLAHTLDIDKLLWVPGAKKIFLPSLKPTYLIFSVNLTKEYLEGIYGMTAGGAKDKVGMMFLRNYMVQNE